MTGAAGGSSRPPGGSSRPPGDGAPPEGTGAGPERTGRPPESASFETSRLGDGRRARPSVLGAVFLVVLGGIVAVGISGRLGAGAFPLGAENQALSTGAVDTGPAAATAPAGSPAAPTPRVIVEFPADTGPIFTSDPGPMAIQAKRHPQTIFVHGDVDAAQITWVYVGVLDDAGRVAGWTSISVPGAAGPNANGGPTMRFDVELAITEAFQGRLWVRAQAYGIAGSVVASASVEVPAAP